MCRISYIEKIEIIDMDGLGSQLIEGRIQDQIGLNLWGDLTKTAYMLDDYDMPSQVAMHH